MSVSLSGIGESFWGIPSPFRSSIAALTDPSFNPGLTSTLDASTGDDGPLSPTSGFVRARYGPYLLYLHPSSFSSSASPLTPKQLNWSITSDFAFAAAWDQDKISITCNINTYSYPHTDAGDGWCGCCGVPGYSLNAAALGLAPQQLRHPGAPPGEELSMQASGSADHWYAQTGLHTSASSHTGPLAAATTLPALLLATEQATTHHAERLRLLATSRSVSEDAEEEHPDAWVAGMGAKMDLSADTAGFFLASVDEDVFGLGDAAKPAVSLDLRMGAVADERAALCTALDGNLFTGALAAAIAAPGSVKQVVWVPLHWGGYAMHSVAVVVTSTGFLIAICPLSLRIIQIQHVAVEPALAGGGARQQGLRGVAAAAVRYTSGSIQRHSQARGQPGASEAAAGAPLAPAASAAEVQYSFPPRAVDAVYTASDGDAGALLAVRHDRGTWMCGVGAIAADLALRVRLPTACGYSSWPAFAVDSRALLLHPLRTFPPSQRPLPLAVPAPASASVSHNHNHADAAALAQALTAVLPADTAAVAVVPAAAQADEYVPVAAPAARVRTGWLAGDGAGLSVVKLRPSQRPPQLLRRVAAALVDMAASWWFGSKATPVTRYLAALALCAAETRPLLADARRVVAGAVQPPAQLVPTATGLWSAALHQGLARAHACRRHAAPLYTSRRQQPHAPLPLPLLPWSSALTLAPRPLTAAAAPRLLALTDSLGRVLLLDAGLHAVVHKMGGYRGGQVFWTWAVPVARTALPPDAGPGAGAGPGPVPRSIHEDGWRGACSLEGETTHATEHTPPAQPVLLTCGARGVADVWAVHPAVSRVGSVQVSGGAVVDCVGWLLHAHLYDSAAGYAVWESQRQELASWPSSRGRGLKADHVLHPLAASASASGTSDAGSEPPSKPAPDAAASGARAASMTDADAEDEFFDLSDSLEALEDAARVPEERPTRQTRPRGPSAGAGVTRVLCCLYGVVVVSERGGVDALMLELDVPGEAEGETLNKPR